MQVKIFFPNKSTITIRDAKLSKNKTHEELVIIEGLKRTLVEKKLYSEFPKVEVKVELPKWSILRLLGKTHTKSKVPDLTDEWERLRFYSDEYFFDIEYGRYDNVPVKYSVPFAWIQVIETPEE